MPVPNADTSRSDAIITGGADEKRHGYQQRRTTPTKRNPTCEKQEIKTGKEASGTSVQHTTSYGPCLSRPVNSIFHLRGSHGTRSCGGTWSLPKWLKLPSQHLRGKKARFLGVLSRWWLFSKPFIAGHRVAVSIRENQTNNGAGHPAGPAGPAGLPACRQRLQASLTFSRVHQELRYRAFDAPPNHRHHYSAGGVGSLASSLSLPRVAVASKR